MEQYIEPYLSWILEKLQELTAIDSPSGYTHRVSAYLMEEYWKMGYEPVSTQKGGGLVTLGGGKAKEVQDQSEPSRQEGAILTAAHVDTLGAVVAEVKVNGRLRLSPIGAVSAHILETENCRVCTRFGEVYEGTCQLVNASYHVNGEFNQIVRNYQNIEIVLDEDVASAEDVKKLGIDNGDYVCFDPVTKITKSGYIKSRFLDDKLSAAILMGYAKYLKETGKTPKRKVYQYFTVFEEIGHGASASVQADVTDVLSVDMGCVGEGLSCTEKEVSICTKDSGGPYHYGLTTELVKAAREAGVSYALDVYPFYTSDVEATLKSGYDVRHALIGPGVYASHGYERSHVDGVKNTFHLLCAYLGTK